MSHHRFIYLFKYDHHYKELCRLEARHIFNAEDTNKLLFSNVEIEPSLSPFIKRRFEIIAHSDSYSGLLNLIRKEHIQSDGFKAEYLALDGDTTCYSEKLEKLKDIGYCIEGTPDYYNPLIIYSICHYRNRWYFGILTKHNMEWHKHQKKPCSFSSAININIAKSLVNIASEGDKARRLLDGCCGVGTVMLEACFSGFNIEGCDINWKACKNTRKNLAHFNYSGNVYRTDIKDMNKKYDAVIVDLPYNLYTYSNDNTTLNIIESAAKLSSTIIIVSITDIETIINQSGLVITDFCPVGKSGKAKFTRKIWVCEKDKGLMHMH